MARVTLFAGHYGSGKTNIALNYARALSRSGKPVAIADLDIVNPYFRTKDSKAQLEREGIELIVSDFANSNVDFPALPKEAYSLFSPSTIDQSVNRLIGQSVPSPSVIVDVGGDDRGALALGRYVDDIKAENDYEMLGVINASRPLTQTPEATVEVLREIEAASRLPFTGLVNNTNLGLETTAETVLNSLDYANKVAEIMQIPVKMTTVAQNLMSALEGKVPALFAIDLQKLYYFMV